MTILILEGGRPVPRNFNEPILEEYRWEYTTISKYGNEWDEVENFENVTQLQVAILDKDIEAVKANFESRGVGPWLSNLDPRGKFGT